MTPIGFALMAMMLGPEPGGAEAPPSEPAPLATAAPEEIEPAEQINWEFSLSASLYILEDDDEYVQTTITADYDWLHLEARHQYEDLDTASIWVGYNLSFGEELTLDLTPMIGGVFGDTDGVALGYEATLAWRQFELYTEGEYVFDSHDSDDNYFYTWSELSYAPLDWLRAGLVIQRTKTYDTDFDIQRGFLVGLMFEPVDFTAYVFNPDDDPTFVLGVSVTF